MKNLKIDDNELNALIKLLDDPDISIYNIVEKKLIEQGPEVIKQLESVWSSSWDGLQQDRLENIIHKIQFNDIYTSLKIWTESKNQDLLHGATLIAKYNYPDITVEDISKSIDKIKKDAQIALRGNLTELEQIRVLNHIFFDIYKFTGNNTNFFSPQNSFINQVLETKKGNPISLAVIYQIVAQELNLPVFGVNLPKNFILAYIGGQQTVLKSTENEFDEVLFYINPYNRGVILGKKEIDYFIKQQQLEPQESYFYPCSNLTTIHRLVMNLLFAYEKLGYTNKISDLQKIEQLFLEPKMPF